MPQAPSPPTMTSANATADGAGFVAGREGGRPGPTDGTRRPQTRQGRRRPAVSQDRSVQSGDRRAVPPLPSRCGGKTANGLSDTVETGAKTRLGVGLPKYSVKRSGPPG